MTKQIIIRGAWLCKDAARSVNTYGGRNDESRTDFHNWKE